MSFNYTKLIKKIPTEPRILGTKNLFHAVVFAPFMLIDNEYHLLFQKRAPHIRQGNEISFPGGCFDNKHDTTIIDTAIRETIEELGILQKHITCDAILGSIVAPMGSLVDITIGTINTKIDNFSINKNEVASIFTVPISYFIKHKPEVYTVYLYIHPEPVETENKTGSQFPAKRLGLPDQYHTPWGGKKHPVYIYETDYGPLWGLTAQIIQEILKFIN